jgi:prolyl 4-hydroxylase
VAQAQAGHKPDAVLTSMRASGWAEDVALAAMEQTLQGFLVEQAQAQGLPPPVRRCPSVDLADASACTDDAGDRRVAC